MTAAAPQLCVVIPVFNHSLTVGRVAIAARDRLPVIAVDDGSTDGTAALLAELKDIAVVSLPENRGKAAALRAGFAEALRQGFTHAITIDADGQHSAAELDGFIRASMEEPEAFVIGVRDLRKEKAPWPRRLANALSTLCFRMETGIPLSDTQCGYRCYPLLPISQISTATERYSYELEVMVKAAWAGIPLVPLPVSADYASPTSRLSHFDPLKDLLRVAGLHLRLMCQALWHPSQRRCSSGARKRVGA